MEKLQGLIKTKDIKIVLYDSNLGLIHNAKREKDSLFTLKKDKSINKEYNDNLSISNISNFLNLDLQIKDDIILYANDPLKYFKSELYPSKVYQDKPRKFDKQIDLVTDSIHKSELNEEIKEDL